MLRYLDKPFCFGMGLVIGFRRYSLVKNMQKFLCIVHYKFLKVVGPSLVWLYQQLLEKIKPNDKKLCITFIFFRMQSLA